MAKDKREIPPTRLTRKWLDQDVNRIRDLENHGVRLVHDFVNWSELSGEVKTYKMSKEELAKYNAK